MEVVCRSERFTVASTLCPRELDTPGSWRSQVREINQAVAQPWEGIVDNTDIVIRDPALITAGCASTDKMVYAVR